MKKPAAIHDYSQTVTEVCERVWATLIRRLGPWHDSIFLVGVLTPRFRIKSRPPAVPAHAGTGDVDAFRIHAETQLVPTLSRGDIAVMDSPGSGKSETVCAATGSAACCSFCPVAPI